ncbi:MAG: NADH-quinone oxidoreductase subunit NuoE [Sutterellaceae bacterium]|nr:NADH-quinone oxidoreductase subunit NuoE [Burkholderiaceae bacterium]MCX7902258.1 NADH-quinone oxidoreductase subunit NuoE [Burkholderiaceae bacterium]MDW8430735.1 NADH-quinone oxidoreductase subunit NuoE [Sutterellaceae bacterium]
MLSPEAYRAIDREIAKYPPGHKQSAVIAALAIAQGELGWVSKEAIEEVAAYLEMPPIAVYEVATFYNMFDTQPVGRFKLVICTNLPCALAGANRAAAHLKARLGIDFGETTPDSCFTLKEGECMGACADAPVLLVNNTRMESFMSEERLDALLAELKAKAQT